ncbi:MAG: hypothetical protein CMM52_08610 [Rhodospirillaceae bacterium]|nr:hypothetical protein [Rhodospirillaceae bacterium]|tara:strand:+ start:8628 stop:9287 length:660 start_codon:yes stop_codon:yes gene_type:complete
MSEEAKSQQEPSMEEILASIRRIISEDENDESKPADGSSEETHAENDDVLELTEVVEEEAPVEEEASEPVEEVAEEVTSEEPQSQDDIDSLFEEAESTEDEIELVDEDDDQSDEGVPEEVSIDPPESDTSAEVSAPAGGLLDDEPATATTSSLSNLVAAVDADNSGTPLGDGNRTIEDLVKEVMRPMIKEWLDDNLPALVDRVVRREIERLSRTAEGDE